MSLVFSYVDLYNSIDEILIIIVSIIIAYYSRKIYRLIEDKHFKLFSFAFIFIAIAFLFKIFSDITVLYRVEIQQANFVWVVMSQLKNMQIINFFSFTLFKVFYLIGFLILFLIVTKTENKEKIFLFIYFSIISILLSIYFNFVFHITLLFILFFLIIHFYENHKKFRTLNTFLVLLAFLIIFISHFFLVFSDFYTILNLVGGVFLLIGFLSLLINQIKLTRKNEPKTNKTGSNKGHIRSLAKKQAS